MLFFGLDYEVFSNFGRDYGGLNAIEINSDICFLVYGLLQVGTGMKIWGDGFVLIFCFINIVLIF